MIHLQPAAPAKPPPGAPCNGCGACCAWQPCPVGMVLSRRRHGACVALQWEVQAQVQAQLQAQVQAQGQEVAVAPPCPDGAGSAPGRYVCGALLEPGRWLPLLRLLPSAWRQNLVRRWIAAGDGCDADFETQTLR